MNEQERGTPLAFYFIVGSLVVLALGICGLVLYVNWGRIGLPDPAAFVEEVQQAHTGDVKGAVVVEGNAANYLKYVNREDVFVMVNFYHRWDQYSDDLKLDLKRLSARHEGEVVLMNIDLQRSGEITKGMKIGRPPVVALMHAGEQVGRFSGDNLVWDIEEVVTSSKDRLIDPIRHAGSDVDPYAESLRKQGGDFVPEGVAPID